MSTPYTQGPHICDNPFPTIGISIFYLLIYISSDGIIYKIGAESLDLLCHATKSSIHNASAAIHRLRELKPKHNVPILSSVHDYDNCIFEIFHIILITIMPECATNYNYDCIQPQPCLLRSYFLSAGPLLVACLSYVLYLQLCR